MRRTLISLSLTLVPFAVLAAQTAAPSPAAPRPVAQRAAARPSTLTIQVTDTLGAPLAETQVTGTGPVAREGKTTADGSLRFTNMRAGTYRLRFMREGSITLERDITLRAGQSLTEDVSLTAASASAPGGASTSARSATAENTADRPSAPDAPSAPVAPVAPSALAAPVAPKVTPVPLFLEKNFIGGREGRKDSSLGCTPTATATLHQLRDSWPGHAHDDADEWIYVVAGEGTLRIGTSDHRLQAGTFILVPHGMDHALIPQGRNPLIVTSVLSGPACQG